MSNLDRLLESTEVKPTVGEALGVVDMYLRDCDSIMSRERKNRMIHAMGLLLPKSDFAKREYE